MKRTRQDVASNEHTTEQLVSDALQLFPAFRHAELTTAGRRAAGMQAAAILRVADPLFAQLVDIRIITTRRGTEVTNHVNMRVAAAFTTMLHPERARAGDDELLFCFLASEQLEPIVVVVVVHAQGGRIERLAAAHMPALEIAITQFKNRFSERRDVCLHMHPRTPSGSLVPLAAFSPQNSYSHRDVSSLLSSCTGARVQPCMSAQHLRAFQAQMGTTDVQIFYAIACTMEYCAPTYSQ